MKLKIIIGIIILLALTLGVFGYLNYKKEPALPGVTNLSGQSNTPATLPSAQGVPFKWGVYTNAFAANDIDDSFSATKMDEQIKVIKDLGVEYVLTNYEAKGGGVPLDEVNDVVIDKLFNAGFKIVLSVGDGFMLDGTSYQKAFNLGKATALKYKGKIAVYQLLNEVDGTAVKPNHPGFRLSDYDVAKYKDVEMLVKGLSDGVRAGDPNTKRMVTAHWLGIGAIDELIKNKVQFEIVGWHWYSDMGPDPTRVTLKGISGMRDGTQFNLAQHYVKQGKEFWLTEANRTLGSFPQNEEEQAAYIKNLAEIARKSGYITGYFVYKLTDGAENAGKSAWGIYKTTSTSDGTSITLGPPKKAFSVFKEIIQSSQ